MLRQLRHAAAGTPMRPPSQLSQVGLQYSTQHLGTADGSQSPTTASSHLLCAHANTHLSSHGAGERFRMHLVL